MARPLACILLTWGLAKDLPWPLLSDMQICTGVCIYTDGEREESNECCLLHLAALWTDAFRGGAVMHVLARSLHTRSQINKDWTLLQRTVGSIVCDKIMRGPNDNEVGRASSNWVNA